jgi:hypothetical protein
MNGMSRSPSVRMPVATTAVIRGGAEYGDSRY